MSEDPDVALFSGSITVSGVLASTEAPDNPFFFGTLSTSGAFALAEAVDHASMSGGGSGSVGILAATGGVDHAAFAGVVNAPAPVPVPEPDTIIFRPSHPTYNYPRPKQIAPIVLYDQLTEKEWGYNDVPSMLRGLPYFYFDMWKPSIYDIINTTSTALPVLLFNTTYQVNQNEWWRFVAHDEIESHHGVFGALNMSAAPPLPYWDPLLGGSFWDSYQSPWDGGHF